MEWIIERINLDPDAFSCAIIIAILLVFMVVTVAIWAVWRVAYIKLWRWNRRKKSPLSVKTKQEGKQILRQTLYRILSKMSIGGF